MGTRFATPIGAAPEPSPAGGWTRVRVPAFDARLAEVRTFLDSDEATGLWRFQTDADPHETRAWGIEFSHAPTAVLFKMRFG